MTTLQEAARNAIMALQEARTRLEWFVDSYPHDVVDKKNFFVGTDAAIESLRTALAQQGEQQPSAYLTIADTGDMVWPPEAYDEACTYCDDDENPVPLYTAAPAPQAQQGEQQPPYPTRARAIDAPNMWGAGIFVVKEDEYKALRSIYTAAPAPQEQLAVCSARAAFESSERCGYAYDCGSYTAGYEQGKYDEQMYQGPAPQPEHECTRSHPHELMDGYCELRTEIARLTNENARLKAAPQPAQDVPETNFGNMPTKFLANGTRFKVNFDGDGGV